VKNVYTNGKHVFQIRFCESAHLIKLDVYLLYRNEAYGNIA